MARESDVEDVPVERLERLLEGWFRRPVLLLASGRSGIFLLLRYAGLTRHRSTIQIAPFHSRCVINALTHHAIPVLAPQPGTATLLYHQFGFSQRTSTSGFVIEDLAHAFFSAPGSGERDWASDFAIFSLPKFFGLDGPAGGVIARTPEQIDALRTLLEAFPRADDEVRAWMRRVWRAAFGGGGSAEPELWLESVYELLFTLPHGDERALPGMPRTCEGLAEVGAHRARLVATFLSRFGAVPSSLWPSDGAIPYALPFFARDESLIPEARGELERLGLSAGDYHIDVRRNMNNPDYRRCLLIPAHHDVPLDRFEAACAVLTRFA